MDHDAAIRPRPEGDPGGAIDGHRQHEAVVVVGVLADQIDPPRRPHDALGRRAKVLDKMTGRLLRAKRHGKDSSTRSSERKPLWSPVAEVRSSGGGLGRLPDENDRKSSPGTRGVRSHLPRNQTLHVSRSLRPTVAQIQGDFFGHACRDRRKPRVYTRFGRAIFFFELEKKWPHPAWIPEDLGRCFPSEIAQIGSMCALSAALRRGHGGKRRGAKLL